MARPELINTLYRIAEPVVVSMDLCLWGIELIPGTRPLVRIYVDAPLEEKASCTVEKTPSPDTDANLENTVSIASATVEQCARISRMVGLAMEVDDIFSTAYILEVSSPGFSRPFFQLQQMTPYVGDTIEVSLMDFLPDCPEAFKGRKKFRGELVHVAQEDFTMRVDAGAQMHEICLPFSEVRKASRVHIFVAPEKPGKKRKEK